MRIDHAKPYKGIAMEGAIAKWYTRNTGRDMGRFRAISGAVAQRTAAGAEVLEVAPGPGYLAIELAKAGRRVTGLDISKSFIEIGGENARRAGVTIEFRHGNASAMPFTDACFDFVVCVAAFKNFTDPVGAVNEMHRVLRPGGQAVIYDLRKDAGLKEIHAAVQGMRLSAFDAQVTRWTFRFYLLKAAYTREQFERIAATSRFGACEIAEDGIGFEVNFRK
jgi:ubiquinone/menaquinone biosynthesis C-methylase UbiE